MKSAKESRSRVARRANSWHLRSKPDPREAYEALDFLPRASVAVESAHRNNCPGFTVLYFPRCKLCWNWIVNFLKGVEEKGNERVRMLPEMRSVSLFYLLRRYLSHRVRGIVPDTGRVVVTGCISAGCLTRCRGFFIVFLQKSLCWIRFSMDSRYLESQDLDVPHQKWIIYHICILYYYES